MNQGLRIDISLANLFFSLNYWSAVDTIINYCYFYTKYWITTYRI